MKTCYYELLDVRPIADDDELKKAYRRKALQFHPDKNPNNVEEATQIFASIRAAYEVLSDPQERAWYDSHKEQILNDEPIGTNQDGEFEYEVDASVTGVTTDELLMFFNSALYTRVDDSPAGFYQIAGRVFARLAKDEVLNGRRLGLTKYNLYQDDTFEGKVNASGYSKTSEQYIKEFGASPDSLLFPPFGQSSTDYEYLKTFYKKWSGFNTLKSFSWKDEYMYSKNYDRRTKREINKRNEKARQIARNEYNKTVKRFVSFIKKIDKRMKDGLRKSEESKRARARQRQKDLKDASNIERSKAEDEFKPQNWQAINEKHFKEMEKLYAELEDEEATPKLASEDFNEEEEFIVYDCFLCNKRFKSEKQLENHCKTKLHKRKIAEVQKEMKKESMTLGLDDLSDLDEFNSAEEFSNDDASDAEGDDASDAEGDEIDEVESESDDGSSLNAVDEELAQIEEQLARMEMEQSQDDDDNTETDESQGPTDSPDGPEKPFVEDESDALSQLLASLNNEEEQAEQGWQNQDKPTRSKAKRKKNKNGKQGPESQHPASPNAPNRESCGTCGAEFDSRNKLFKHVTTNNHAALRSEVNPKKAAAHKKKSRK